MEFRHEYAQKFYIRSTSFESMTVTATSQSLAQTTFLTSFSGNPNAKLVQFELRTFVIQYPQISRCQEFRYANMRMDTNGYLKW